VVLAGVLRAIIADDSRLLVRVSFTGFWDGDWCDRLLHPRLEVPAKNCSTCSVEYTDEEVEGASDLEIGEVCMPVIDKGYDVISLVHLYPLFFGFPRVFLYIILIEPFFRKL